MFGILAACHYRPMFYRSGHSHRTLPALLVSPCRAHVDDEGGRGESRSSAWDPRAGRGDPSDASRYDEDEFAYRGRSGQDGYGGPPPPPPRRGYGSSGDAGGRYDSRYEGPAPGRYDAYDDHAMFPPPPPPPPRTLLMRGTMPGEHAAAASATREGAEEADPERTAFEAELQRVADQLDKVRGAAVSQLDREHVTVSCECFGQCIVRVAVGCSVHSKAWAASSRDCTSM